jgi:hypothetical protein
MIPFAILVSITQGESDTAIYLGVGMVLVLLALGTYGTFKMAPLLRKVSHGVDDLFGETARPGVPASPGLKEIVTTLASEVTEIRDVQVTLGAVARAAADNANQIATKQVEDIEEARLEREEIRTKVNITNKLLVRHLHDGKNIMAVGVENDRRLAHALTEHGIVVPEPLDYPEGVEYADGYDDEGNPK